MKSLLLFSYLLLFTRICSAQSHAAGGPAAPGAREPINVQTPNEASLGSFGNPTISQFTGSPSVEVPLYTVQEGSLSVPIALHYNSAGFRPDEHPGWVGLGWSLQVGGVITRVVNRMPDEHNESGSSSMTPVYGYYFTNQLLRPASPTSWTSRTFLENIAARTSSPIFYDTEPDEFSFTLPGCSGSFYKDSDGNNDPFGTVTGRGTWKVRCDQPVRVSVNNPADPFLTVPFTATKGFYNQHYGGVYPKTFAGFTITTTDGTRYVFGHDEGSATAPMDRPAIEYSMGLFDQVDDYWTATAWQLSKVISPAGDQITLNYAREVPGASGRFITQMYTGINESLNVQQTNDSNTWFNWADMSCPDDASGLSNNEATIIKKAFSGKLLAPVYLQNIQTRSGDIVFERSISRELRYEQGNLDQDRYSKFTPISNFAAPGGSSNYPFIETSRIDGQPGKVHFDNSIAKLQWQKLDAISIRRQGQVLKSWRLKYSDSPDVTDAVAKAQRLTLLAVTEVGKDGTAKPPYQFSYYNGGAGLPKYLMFVSDHWGFYNNVTNESSPTNATTPSIPDYRNVSLYKPLREPNTAPRVYLRGLLTDIQYPTGGKTSFEYEQHQYGSQVDTMRTLLDPGMTTVRAAGGVRIKKITSATVSNPQPGDKIVAEYYYVKKYTPGANISQLPSSGVLGSQIKYVYSHRTYQGTGGWSGAHFAQSMFSSQSVLPASGNSQGSHIGYSEVVEKRTDGSYSKYLFSNFSACFDYDNINGLGQPTQLDQGHFDEPPLQSLETDKNGIQVYDQFSSRAQERGKLLQTADYTATGVCVQRRRINYAAFNPGTEFVPLVYGRQLNVCTTFAALQGVSYKLNTYAFLPTQETITVYNNAGASGLTTTKTYTYANFQNRTINLLLEQNTINSKGQSSTLHYNYPFALINSPTGATNPVARALSAMTNLYMLNSPVETISSLNGRITGATVQTFTFPGTSTTLVKPFQTWQLELNQSIADNDYARAAFSSSGSGALLTLDPNLRLKRTCMSYDNRGNLLGLQTEGAFSTAYVWDYAKSLPVAIAQNAAPNQVAYAGFEADMNGQFVSNNYVTYDPNNWDYDPRPGLTTHVQTGRSFTGHGFYRLDGGWGVSRSNLPADDYEVSFWAKGGLANVYIFVDQELSRYEGPANANDQDYRFVRFRVHVNQGNSVNIDAYGRQVDIDDVRLCPVAAQMTSYTHDPLVGATTTSDAANRPTFFEYDGLQRLKMTRDAEGNITKHLEYHYQQ